MFFGGNNTISQTFCVLASETELGIPLIFVCCHSLLSSLLGNLSKQWSLELPPQGEGACCP